MKMLNKKFVRTLSCAAVAVCAAAMLSVGAFAAEVDSTCVEGYLPPQEQMVQGDIALHSGDVAVGEKDPSYGGYGAPEGNPIQGNIMLISGDELADTAKTEARYTVKGLLGKQLLYTARQKDGVLTLDVPAEVATFRTTIEAIDVYKRQGVVEVDHRPGCALDCLEGAADDVVAALGLSLIHISPTPRACPAVSSSASPLPARWQWIRT